MATEIKTSIQIKATPNQVWEVLTNFQAYPEWNPFVKSVEGTVAAGNRIKVTITDMVFKPKVLRYEPNKAFVWLGNLLVPGLFDGKHQFFLTDNGNGTTTLHHCESFKGILVPLFRKKLLPKTRAGFEAMNEKLKERVEQNAYTG